MSKYKRYLYLEPKTQCPIMVLAKRKPSIYTVPQSGTWVVREWYARRWDIPCFPEITWGVLKYFKFIGEIK